MSVYDILRSSPPTECCNQWFDWDALQVHMAAAHNGWWIDTGAMELVRVSDGRRWPLEDTPAGDIPMIPVEVEAFLRKQRER